MVNMIGITIPMFLSSCFIFCRMLQPRPGGGAGRKRGKTGKPGSKPKNKAIPPQSLPDKENMVNFIYVFLIV